MKMFALLLVLAVSACVPVPVPVITVSDGAARQALAGNAPAFAGFERQLNAARTQAGRAPLVSNAALDRVAADFAAELAARGALTHRDRTGGNAMARARRAGVTACGVGENVAQGYGTPDQVFAGWMASPAHRRNMLNATYTNYGIGTADGYWVMVMLLPC